MRNDARALIEWRKAKGLTQADAARLFKVTRVTVARWEKSGGVSDAAAAMMAGEIDAAPEAEAPPAPKPKVKPKAGEVEGTPPALAEAMKRDPLYAKTSAEAFAMRDELHRRALRTNKEAMRSCTPLIPLKPDWQSVQPMTNFTKRPMGDPFKVNAAIPDPVGWARGLGPRAVRTATGAVFDYETAAQMRAAPSN